MGGGATNLYPCSRGREERVEREGRDCKKRGMRL